MVDDTPGWAALTARPHDYDAARLQEIYADALAPLLPALPPALAREALRITFKFIGEPAGERLIEQVMGEVHPPED